MKTDNINNLLLYLCLAFVFFLGFVSIVGTSGGGGGGGGGGGTTPGPSGGTPPVATKSLSGKAMKGAITSATVDVYVLNTDGSKGELLATTTTDSDGEFSLDSLPDSVTGCYILEVTEGSYIDEITGLSESLSFADRLQVVACDPEDGTNYLVATPLTSIAAARAKVLAESGAPLKTAVSSSNIGVSQQFFLEEAICDFPVDPTKASAIETSCTNQRNYGIILAGIANLANSLGADTFSLIAALEEDLSDGVFDGKNDTVSVQFDLTGGETESLSPSAGTTDLQAAIDDFVASPANRANVDAVYIGTGAGTGGIGINTAGRVYVTSTVLPAWFSGHDGSAQLKAQGGRGEYRWHHTDLPDGFELDEDTGVISGTAPVLSPGSSMHITPPFTVTVTDSQDPPTQASVELRITIIESGPTLITQDCEFTQYKFGSSSVVADINGGSPPYAYIIETGRGFPPTGLHLDASGTLSGTPSVTGSYTFGVCAIDLIGAQDCQNVTVNVVKAEYALLVDKAGDGSGITTSEPAGINCGTDCSETYDRDTVVILTASPDSDSTFDGWSGACSSTGSCEVTMDADKAVTATFMAVLFEDAWLGVSKAGNGSGTITSEPAGINCGTDCSETYDKDTEVILTASPDSGSTFDGWSGACSGTGSCGLTMDSDKAVTANFKVTPIEDALPGIAITSVSCDGTRFSWGKTFYKKLTFAGTATGPVGSRLISEIGWTGIECTDWSFCLREEGQPSTTNWTVPKLVNFAIDNTETYIPSIRLEIWERGGALTYTAEAENSILSCPGDGNLVDKP